MCLSHFIFSLMYIPKNFVTALYGIALPSNITCGNTGFLFCIVWKDIASVFSTLTTRLFGINHVCNLFMTLFNLYWRLFIFSSDTNMFVSSANNTIFNPVTFRGRSFMYNENSFGPRIERCGAPCSVSLVVEIYIPRFMLFISTHYFQCDRIQTKSLPYL